MKCRIQDAVDAYGKRRKLQGISQRVLTNERSTLMRMLSLTGNIYMENIRDTHVDDTLAEFAVTNSPRSMANHYGTLRQFFLWSMETGRVRRTPMAGMKPPTYTVTERNRLSVMKFPALLDAARNPRDRILMACGLYTLGRTAEILPIKIGDIKKDLKRVRMDLAKKRGRDDVGTDLKPITIELRTELDRWLSEYSRLFGPLQEEWYLIPTRTAGRAVRTGFNPEDPYGPRGYVVDQVYVPTRHMSVNIPKKVVQEALETVGFPTRADDGTSLNEGMHTLRRSGARGRYDAKRWMGHDNAIRHVQALLNHKHAAMTEHYIGINLDKIQRDEELIDDWMYPQNRTDGVVIDFAAQAAVKRLAETDAMPYYSKQLGRFLTPEEQSGWDKFIAEHLTAPTQLVV